MTRRSRGIHAAWHFWFAVSFGGESGLREVGMCGIHPLTQRYEPAPYVTWAEKFQISYEIACYEE
ncbi:TPA: DUF3265 domain-containing protein [Vibrio vulnificus]|nr:DUF3265 domain-containing protein [Vibrio vulnificus]HDY7447478.1 DUF3265 domain-containing protein [Vibrio vulnificus]HDY7892056.1 DUF3265 domain-containing protein [Vibrio vulnificus]